MKQHSDKVLKWIDSQPGKGKIGVFTRDYCPPNYDEYINNVETQFQIERFCMHRGFPIINDDIMRLFLQNKLSKMKGFTCYF